MDGLFGRNGFTIPAEVNVRLLPRKNMIQDQRLPARISTLSDSDQRPGGRALYTPSEHAPRATPSMSEVRLDSADSRRQNRQPPGSWPEEETDDGRRDSRTEACLNGSRPQHPFEKFPGRGRREASEDYSTYRTAPTVVRDRRQYASYSASSHANQQRQRLITDQSDYEIVKPLRSTGRSRSHEELFLIEDRDSKELFVQKRLRMTSPTSRERATAERNALWQIMAHDNASAHIVQLVEAFYDGESTYSHLVLEYCNSGTLEDFLHRYQQERKSTPEDFAWHVLASLASAVSTCHYGVGHARAVESAPREWKMLCHLDIKPSNIWLTSQQKIGFYPRVVLGGFGLVSTKEAIATRRAHEVVAQYGDRQWMPPEGRSVSNLKLGSATDIWQVGGVIQVLCRLIEVPRSEGVGGGDQSVCGRAFSFALDNIVACCMQPDWRDRPNAIDLAKEVHRVMLGRAQDKARHGEGGGYSVA